MVWTSSAVEGDKNKELHFLQDITSNAGSLGINFQAYRIGLTSAATFVLSCACDAQALAVAEICYATRFVII